MVLGSALASLSFSALRRRSVGALRSERLNVHHSSKEKKRHTKTKPPHQPVRPLSGNAQKLSDIAFKNLQKDGTQPSEEAPGPCCSAAFSWPSKWKSALARTPCRHWPRCPALRKPCLGPPNIPGAAGPAAHFRHAMKHKNKNKKRS